MCLRPSTRAKSRSPLSRLKETAREKVPHVKTRARASEEKAAVLEEIVALLVQTHEARAAKLQEDFASFQQKLLETCVEVPEVPAHKVMRLLREYGTGCASRKRREEPMTHPHPRWPTARKKEEGQ